MTSYLRPMFLSATMLFASVAGHARAGEVRGYVVSWFVDAMYSTEDDCPRGINPRSIEISTKDGKKVVTGAEAANRGTVDGKPVNVYQNPTSTPDPHLLVGEGRFAYGFNLDGRGSASPNSFEDPETHEHGINNQLARAEACIETLRAIPPAKPTNPSYLWGSAMDLMPAWLISINSERSLSENGPVTITFDRALKHAEKDANGDVMRDVSFRIDSDRRSHHVVQGSVSNGLITAEAGDFSMIGDPFFMPRYDFRKTKMRFRIKGDGSLEGVVGGYLPWRDIYWVYGNGGQPLEVSIGMNFPGFFYSLQRLADAEPDPTTGQNTRISTAFKLDAVPAFLLPPVGEKQAIAKP